MKRLLLVLMAGALAACTANSGLTATVISTLNTVGTGQQRLLVELRGETGELMVLDRIVPNATLRDENGSPLGVYPGELVWVVPDEQPAYAFVVDIPEAETYQLSVDVADMGETGPAGFVAVEETIQIGMGELAPPVGDQDVQGPAIVVFASPDHCPSRSCVPTLEQAQEAADADPAVRLVGVEVFANPEAANEDDLVLSPTVENWGLPSQPWLYVVDEGSVVVALFEGAVSDSELAAALELISG